MMGWIIILVLAGLVLTGLWRFAKLDRGTLQFVAAAMLLGMAGYVWQGRPGLAGQPSRAETRPKVADSEFARSRAALLGDFDSASRWLTIAESFQRRGDTKSGVGMVRAGLRAHPRDWKLWMGLGNALVLHGDGLMSPAAELAYRRADLLAPKHPAPKYYYALALAQGGRLDEAQTVWRALLQQALPSERWRALVQNRLDLIETARAISSDRSRGLVQPQ